MAGLRTLALGAALIAATAGAVGAQTTQGAARPDSAKAGEWRKAQPGQRRGQVRPGERRGMKRGMHGAQGHHGRMGMKGQKGRGIGPGAHRRPGMPGMDFMRSLKLTETQRTQVRAIHEKYRPQIQSQTSALHEQIFGEVRAVLTAEQRAKVDARIAERIKNLDESKARLERMRR